jgi:Co/Zn/Cd efflux system component
LDPILSLIIIGLILLKNLNVPGDTFNLMILKENEAVLIKEIKEDIKDKVLEIYEIDEMRLIPMSSVVADFESI